MRQDNRSPVTLMTMGIAGFFLAGFFLLVIFGAQVYQEIVGGQAQNNHTRELMGYLITCAKANDSEGSVMILEREEGPVLVIADGDSGYAFRIYRHEGALVEDYGALESDPNPGVAMVIGETEIFEVEDRGDGTFAVTTDAGVVLFHARSGA
ncbi:MAG: DUF4860 domain-containing protein [Lachnospiraceae bacterium]|jgi:hypothetical protein|nr:DUF4860 domain-containing protein [Lachnospiraceae bacterium]